MPTLTNILVNAAGKPVTGAPVTIELVGLWSATGDRESLPVAAWTGVTDRDGRWQADLPPQSAYEGATYYVVREPGPAKYTVTIADSPSVQSLRSRIPPAVPAPGSPGLTYILSTDSRLSDVRTPTAHAPSHGVGGSDSVTPAAIGAALANHTHPGGGGSSGSPFDFTQTIPAAQWNITHGLGQIPQVTVTDPTGHWMLSDLLYSGANSVVITHGMPLAGSAHLLAASGVAIPYQFNQNTPAATWPVPHGLGRVPQVVVLDPGGNRMLADIVYPDLNTLVITHGMPLAGAAYLL